ncbi:hypothetical protein [Gordonia sp. i37]|uniref:hypothetical protein n=1 Tax=Gordonia sp. i37 TaxID=1961707 RepID=UPI00209A8BA6|nr:hypothetical protein [Gordonia sp. i37]
MAIPSAAKVTIRARRTSPAGVDVDLNSRSSFSASPSRNPRAGAAEFAITDYHKSQTINQLTTRDTIAYVSVIASSSSTKGKGDYCDPIYTSAAEREQDFTTAALGIAIPSTIMLAVGAVVLVSLARHWQGIGRWRTARGAFAVLATLVTMTGYIYLLNAADFTATCQ